MDFLKIVNPPLIYEFEQKLDLFIFEKNNPIKLNQIVIR